MLSINCRFVFHELSSSKIDNKVIFPLENLDLSEYISGPITNKMFYDLQSCVCHFGGMVCQLYVGSKLVLDPYHCYIKNSILFLVAPAS